MQPRSGSSSRDTIVSKTPQPILLRLPLRCVSDEEKYNELSQNWRHVFVSRMKDNLSGNRNLPPKNVS